MTTIDKTEWHRWVDESGQQFDIPAFYYEDGDEVRFELVTVARWLELSPEVMQAFLNRFEPDADDIKAVIDMYYSNVIDQTARDVLQRWVSGVDSGRIEQDENGFPLLPPAPKDPETGKHWGMKYTIGWSNPSGCPDHAILWHALARCDRAAIGEAIRHYGFERVQAYWTRMKEVGPIKKKMTIHSFGNGDLLESTLPLVDQILFKLENTRPPLVLVKCTHCGRLYFAATAEYLRRRGYPEGRIAQLHHCNCGTPADRFTQAGANDAPELATLTPIVTPAADPVAVANYEAWREALDNTP